MLAAAGAVLGIAATPWSSHALKYLMPPGPMEPLVAMDTRPSFAVSGFYDRGLRICRGGGSTGSRIAGGART